jgi:hypothetical protein
MLTETSCALFNFAFLAPRLFPDASPRGFPAMLPGGTERKISESGSSTERFPLGLPSPLVNAALHHVVEIDGEIVAVSETDSDSTS